MSLFNWFGKGKSEPPATAPRTSSALGQLDATLPNVQPVSPAVTASTRKQERHAMRELLYTVVRESMNKMGMLSSSYKFKVLSLDSRGRQYLVMMDVQRLQTGEAARMSEIETMIAQTAKARHDILVTAVYWRVSEHMVAQAPSRQTTATVGATPKDTSRPAFDPIQQDEVDAFKKALAGASRPAAKVGEVVQSGPMAANIASTGGDGWSDDMSFAPTEIDERAAPLSATQYGDL